MGASKKREPKLMLEVRAWLDGRNHREAGAEFNPPRFAKPMPWERESYYLRFYSEGFYGEERDGEESTYA